MSPAFEFLLNFIGVALLYYICLLNMPFKAGSRGKLVGTGCGM